MATFSRKNFVIASGEIIFEPGDTLPQSTTPHNTHNFIDIATAITPTAGTFTAYVETVPNGGFKSLVDSAGANISTIDATLVGSGVADGAALGWSFSGNPHRIKIIAAGVTGVTEVEVVITQNLS